MADLVFSVLLAAAGDDPETGNVFATQLPRRLSEEFVPPAAPAPFHAGTEDDPGWAPPHDLGSDRPRIHARLDASLSAGPDAPDPAAPQTAPPPGPDRAQEPAREEFVHPHHSLGDAFDTHFSAKAWREYVWGDYLTQPAVLLPLGLGVSAAIISHWDKTLQAHWFGVLGNKGWYSDAGQYTLIAAVILDGLLLPGEGRNAWDNAWTIGESYIASSMTTYVLKAAVQRPRPGAGPEAGVGTHSFPSGHSQSAFTAATLIEANSGPLFGIPAYGLAGFTAFERVEEGRHFPSDVLAGAAIGTLSAGIFDALHWGSGGEGGIARPEKKLALDMDGLKGFTLSATFGF
jgi:membrane-associated phospholipid phosphatase